MSNVDLTSKIAAAKLALNTVLLEGGDTSKHRASLRALEGEQQKLDAAVVAQEAAQRVAKEAAARLINEDAARLLEARNNRIAAIATRFAIPSNA
ncbi:hypothetical protein EOS_33050 [Caballeronia mineralivorans PML1(12)]|uniref:Uncharacterized protein n=1 Tax=Caballeronia mineralivorans PML1(12) TaxID=908627 RepID=A0A0J1CNL0_9BURK|nr:hypothetical protein [Caballeronia mineralivorans]KLU21971.1 hypothetical protein EOS_33050 [Caballeronia mineralivorans PML1(12)]